MEGLGDWSAWNVSLFSVTSRPFSGSDKICAASDLVSLFIQRLEIAVKQSLIWSGRQFFRSNGSFDCQTGGRGFSFHQPTPQKNLLWLMMRRFLLSACNQVTDRQKRREGGGWSRCPTRRHKSLRNAKRVACQWHPVRDTINRRSDRKVEIGCL